MIGTRVPFSIFSSSDTTGASALVNSSVVWAEAFSLISTTAVFAGIFPPATSLSFASSLSNSLMKYAFVFASV